MIQKGGLSEFEKLVADIHRSGIKWVEAKLKADQLEEDCKPYLASLINAIDNDAMSEAKLERIARGSPEYRKYIVGMCIARSEALRAKVEYESFLNLFEARRTEAATEREKVKMGISEYGK